MILQLSSRCRRVIFLVSSFGLAAVSVTGQEEPSKLTARQLFFTSRPAAKATAAAPAAPEPKPSQPAPAKRTATKKRPVPPASEPAKPAEQTAAETPKPAEQEAPRSQAVVIPYLGLRYSILQDKPGGARQEVDPEKVFHSKERFFLSLASNDSAYLYVVLKASQGNWEVLFPNPGIDNGNNRLNAKTPVLVPSPSNPFVFDENAGTEKLFIVLSRQPERDLNEVIRSVQHQQPGREPAAAKTIVAANDFDRIRGQMMLASRGIAVEGVKKSPDASTGENAVYLVNTSTQDNSRVIADIVLKHE